MFDSLEDLTTGGAKRRHRANSKQISRLTEIYEVRSCPVDASMLIFL
jgi:hypothetical protein